MDLESLRTTLPVVLLFVFIFPIFWIGVLFLLGYIGGWASLAQTYHFTGLFQDERWSFQSARIGLVNYNRILTVGANQEGLYLKSLSLFQFGHPPLFIPWYDISVRQKSSLLSHTEFRFQRAPSVRLKLGRNLSERLAKAAGEAWPDDVDPLY